MLRNATAKNTFGALILSLLFVSGRRCAEICNGRSLFESVPGKLYAASFHGQLKKRQRTDDSDEDDDGGPSYEIPLLVPFEVFQRGFRALRDKQGHVNSLRNDEVKRRYTANLNRDINEGRCPVPIPTNDGPKFTVHTLRAVHARFVERLFRFDSSFPAHVHACARDAGTWRWV